MLSNNAKKSFIKILAITGLFTVATVTTAQVALPQAPTASVSSSSGDNTIRRLEQLHRELAIKELELKLLGSETGSKSGLPPLPGAPGSDTRATRNAMPSAVMLPPMARSDEFAVVAISGYNGTITAEIVRGAEHYSVSTGDKLPNGWLIRSVTMEAVSVAFKDGKKETVKVLPSDLLYTKPVVLHVLREDKSAAGKQAVAEPRILDMRLGDIVASTQQKPESAKPPVAIAKPVEVGYGANPSDPK